MLNHAIMMTLFMGVNILLGSGVAVVDGEKQFDKRIFFRGVLKASIIAVAIIGINYAGTFAPDMVVVKLNGQDLTVANALLLIIDGAIITYACKSFSNLYKLLKIETGTQVEMVDTESTHKIVEEEEVG